MTKRGLKLLLSIQAKATCYFIGVYALVFFVFLLLSLYANIDSISWIQVFAVYTPKIYLLTMGIIYPPVATKLYVSRGLTRKQFFWAYTGAISIISLFLLIPILASLVYFGSISLSSAIVQYLDMPLFFLIGWTSVAGFQMGKWNTALLGLSGAAAVCYAVIATTWLLALPDLAVLAAVSLLLAALLLILPHCISQIPLKS